MLVLFETSAGYSLFKLAKEDVFEETDASDIYKTMFSTSQQARESMRLVEFQPFSDTAQAVAAATACIEGDTIPDSLQEFLSKHVSKKSSLSILDKHMAVPLKEALQKSSKKLSKLSIVQNEKTHELFRGIRTHIDELFDDSEMNGNLPSATNVKAMQLGLSHSLGRYKLKFSADKVDTMIIQAVGLLDELDKEINTYAMRTKEWYGWHFPELQSILSKHVMDDGANSSSNVVYAQLVQQVGLRENYATFDLSSILSNDNDDGDAFVAAIREAAQMSMGTEIADLDIRHIQELASQVVSLSTYRTQLWDYLTNRMNAMAPNLTVLVGELVGARLISHSGSLLNLAKQPASTIQILGAEKALFRALKTKHNTPKYGLIYHASLIGQAPAKHKGKISRVLAAKAALAVRVDALADDDNDGAGPTIGLEGRAKVEQRLRQLEGITSASAATAFNKHGRLTQQTMQRYDAAAAKTAAEAPVYNDASDMTTPKAVASTPKAMETEEVSTSEKKKKKKKKSKDEASTEKKKRKRSKTEDGDDDDEEDDEKEKADEPSSKKKKKKRKTEDATTPETEEKKKKKKKKKKSL